MKVIKFGATWCSGCLVMKPIWAEIEKENAWLKNEFYDFDTNKEMVEKYKINKELPTFIFLDSKGNEFLRLHGEIAKEKLLQIINENKTK